MTTNTDALTAQLRLRLEKLAHRSGAITRDLRADHDRDWIERATELENDEVLEGLDDITKDQIRQIRAALMRIRQGAYGRCLECQQPIGAARLEAEPTAIRCLRCVEAQG